MNNADDDNDDRLPVFASSRQGLALTMSDVVEVVDDAQKYFPSSESARIEYCRSKGVSYDNFVRYVEFVADASMTFERQEDGDDTEEAKAVDDTTTRMKIIGTPITVVRPASSCPLCNSAEHPLAQCPNLPNELRPFC